MYFNQSEKQSEKEKPKTGHTVCLKVKKYFNRVLVIDNSYLKNFGVQSIYNKFKKKLFSQYKTDFCRFGVQSIHPEDLFHTDSLAHC